MLVSSTNSQFTVKAECTHILIIIRVMRDLKLYLYLFKT